MTHTDDTEVPNIQACISRTTKHRETIFHKNPRCKYVLPNIWITCILYKNIWQKVTHRIKVNLLQAHNQPICYNRSSPSFPNLVLQCQNLKALIFVITVKFSLKEETRLYGT